MEAKLIPLGKKSFSATIADKHQGQTCLSLNLDPDQFLSQSQRALCFPVVPVWVHRYARLHGTLQWRAGVRRRLLSLRGAGVQQWRGFVRVEGSAVVIRPGWTCWPPEVLRRALVVRGVEIFRASSLYIRMPERNHWRKPF